MFFIVDSDDYLARDATQIISDIWEKEDIDDLLGICLRRVSPNSKEIIGKEFPYDGVHLSPSEINFKYKINCDKAEIFRTTLLKKTPFPEFEGEKFLTEAYWAYLLEKKEPSKFTCYNKGVRYTEYMPDGLTRNRKQVRLENPRGYIAYYKLELKMSQFYRNPVAVTSAIFHIIWLTIYKRKRG